MKERYRMVVLGNRGGMCYCKDTVTGARTSLNTKDPSEGEKLILHKNEAVEQPHINRKIGLAYLSAADPELVKRDWNFVMEDIVKDKTGSTLKRYKTALKDPAFKLIADKPIVETLSGDLIEVLRVGTTCTNVYLRRFQNHAVDMGWLPVPVLPKKKFPKIKHKDQRAITWNEHCRIIEREKNPERRDYYELCWHFGGSQTDIADLKAEDIDYDGHGFCYSRRKTDNLGGTKIGPKAWEIIMRRPKEGPMFPYLSTVREADRATEFKQRSYWCSSFAPRSASSAARRLPNPVPSQRARRPSRRSMYWPEYRHRLPHLSQSKSSMPPQSDPRSSALRELCFLVQSQPDRISLLFLAPNPQKQPLLSMCSLQLEVSTWGH